MTPAPALVLAAAMVASGGDRAIESLRGDTPCGDCHKVIEEEWLRSAHARAATDTEALEIRRLYFAANKRPAGYLAPAILLAEPPGAPPKPRTVFAGRGVDCVACHADAQFAMHGPLGTQAPHKVVADAGFREAAACATCHGQGDYLDQYSSWKESSYNTVGIPCQQCHMPAVERPLVQHWALGALPARDSRQHTFAGADDEEFVRRAIKLTLNREGRKLRGSVANVGAGHWIPGMGMRELVVEVRLADERRRTVRTFRETVGLDAENNRIAPGETRRWEWDIPPGAVSAVATLRYKKFYRWPDERGRLVAEESLRWEAGGAAP